MTVVTGGNPVNRFNEKGQGADEALAEAVDDFLHHLSARHIDVGGVCDVCADDRGPKDWPCPTAVLIEDFRADFSSLVAALAQQDTDAATGKTADEALNEAALRIERELICCDVYERITRGEMDDVIRDRDYHAICHYAGAARALVLDGLAAPKSLVADALAVLGQDQAANEGAVLLRAALNFEYHAGNRAPHLSNEENRALSDANLRAAVHLRHLARVGFEPVASASPVPLEGN